MKMAIWYSMTNFVVEGHIYTEPGNSISDTHFYQNTWIELVRFLPDLCQHSALGRYADDFSRVANRLVEHTTRTYRITQGL